MNLHGKENMQSEFGRKLLFLGELYWMVYEREADIWGFHDLKRSRSFLSTTTCRGGSMCRVQVLLLISARCRKFDLPARGEQLQYSIAREKRTPSAFSVC